MNRLLFVGVVLVTSYLAGCATPEILYRADPVPENTVWYSGLEFQTETKDSVTVSIAFENEFGGEMTFYTVVGNMGSRPILVSPEAIYCTGNYRDIRETTDFVTMDVTHDTLNDTQTVYAMDPEEELGRLDQEAAVEQARYINNTGLNAAAGLMQLIGNVATIGQKKSKEERHRERRSTRDLLESQRENEEEYFGNMSSLSAQRSYWRDAALRKTTLFQDNAIGGKVRFHVIPMYGRLSITVPIESESFQFQFSQHRLLLPSR